MVLSSRRRVQGAIFLFFIAEAYPPGRVSLFYCWGARQPVFCSSDRALTLFGSRLESLGYGVLRFLDSILDGKAGGQGHPCLDVAWSGLQCQPELLFCRVHLAAGIPGAKLVLRQENSGSVWIGLFQRGAFSRDIARRMQTSASR